MLASALVMVVVVLMFKPTYARLRLDQVNLSVASEGQKAGEESKHARRNRKLLQVLEPI